jgi:hypothetical protein
MNAQENQKSTLYSTVSKITIKLNSFSEILIGGGGEIVTRNKIVNMFKACQLCIQVQSAPTHLPRRWHKVSHGCRLDAE